MSTHKLQEEQKVTLDLDSVITELVDVLYAVFQKVMYDDYISKSEQRSIEEKISMGKKLLDQIQDQVDKRAEK